MDPSLVEIQDLPDEVLCHIFSQLNVECVIKCVMNVCQRWKKVVAEEKRFWNNVQLVVDCDYFLNYSFLDSNKSGKSPPDFISEDEIIHIGEKDLDRVFKVQNIKFIHGSTIIDKTVSLLLTILDIISKHCQNIENVEFFFCFGIASREVAKFLREKFTTIKEIRCVMNSSICTLPYREISRFTYLKTLVSHDKMFKSSDLYHLSEGCEHLSSLWILLCTSIKKDDILYFIERKKYTLKELGMGSCLQDFILDKLKDCHNLEVFFATDASDITDDCLKSFAHQSCLKYCSLHRATIQQTTIIDIAGISRKPDIFKHLKILDLTYYNNYQAEFFNSWNSLHNKSKNFVELTFINPYMRSISQPYYSTDTQEHWMYRHRYKPKYSNEEELG